MNTALINLAYVVAATLFIFGLKGLASPRTAVRANLMGALGMLIAVVVTLADRQIIAFEWILGGIVLGSAIVTLLLVAGLSLVHSYLLLARYSSVAIMRRSATE